MSKSIVVFLTLGGLFALTHVFATITSLYWYYPWFDVVMHFWGGLLIVLGVRVLNHLQLVKKTNKRTVFGIALLMMLAWEVFEYTIGFVSQSTYLFDTIKDIFVGGLGVLTGYLILKQKNKSYE